MFALRPRLASRLAAWFALSPAMTVLLVVYIGCTVWTIWISMTASRMLPSSTFVGLRQYEALFANERWNVSVTNLAVFGVLFMIASLTLGFLLAVAIDQRVGTVQRETTQSNGLHRHVLEALEQRRVPAHRHVEEEDLEGRAHRLLDRRRHEHAVHAVDQQRHGREQAQVGEHGPQAEAGCGRGRAGHEDVSRDMSRWTGVAGPRGGDYRCRMFRHQARDRHR